MSSDTCLFELEANLDSDEKQVYETDSFDENLLLIDEIDKDSEETDSSLPSNKIICTYTITNRESQKKYYGSTNDYERRFKEHFRGLRGNYHGNSHLQNSWNKYGEDVFTMSIIEEFVTRDEAEVAEQLLLDEHFGTERCYNLSSSAKTVVLTLEQRTRWWRNATVEQKNAILQKQKAAWDAMSPEKRQQRNDKISVAMVRRNREFWATASLSQRDARRNAIITGQKAMSVEQKNDMRENQKVARTNASPEQKQVHADGISRGKRAWWDSISTEQRNIVLLAAHTAIKRAIIINGITYESITEAARKLNCSQSMIAYRYRHPDKFPNYQIVAKIDNITPTRSTNIIVSICDFLCDNEVLTTIIRINKTWNKDVFANRKFDTIFATYRAIEYYQNCQRPRLTNFTLYGYSDELPNILQTFPELNSLKLSNTTTVNPLFWSTFPSCVETLFLDYPIKHERQLKVLPKTLKKLVFLKTVYVGFSHSGRQHKSLLSNNLEWLEFRSKYGVVFEYKSLPPGLRILRIPNWYPKISWEEKLEVLNKSRKNELTIVRYELPRL